MQIDLSNSGEQRKEESKRASHESVATMRRSQGKSRGTARRGAEAKEIVGRGKTAEPGPLSRRATEIDELKFTTNDDIEFWDRYNDYDLKSGLRAVMLCGRCKTITNDSKNYKCSKCNESVKGICRYCWKEIAANGHKKHARETCIGTHKRGPVCWGFVMDEEWVKAREQLCQKPKLSIDEESYDKNIPKDEYVKVEENRKRSRSQLTRGITKKSRAVVLEEEEENEGVEDSEYRDRSVLEDREEEERTGMSEIVDHLLLDSEEESKAQKRNQPASRGSAKGNVLSPSKITIPRLIKSPNILTNVLQVFKSREHAFDVTTTGSDLPSFRVEPQELERTATLIDEELHDERQLWGDRRNYFTLNFFVASSATGASIFKSIIEHVERRPTAEWAFTKNIMFEATKEIPLDQIIDAMPMNAEKYGCPIINIFFDVDSKKSEWRIYGDKFPLIAMVLESMKTMLEGIKPNVVFWLGSESSRVFTMLSRYMSQGTMIAGFGAEQSIEAKFFWTMRFLPYVSNMEMQANLNSIRADLEKLVGERQMAKKIFIMASEGKTINNNFYDKLSKIEKDENLKLRAQKEAKGRRINDRASHEGVRRI